MEFAIIGAALRLPGVSDLDELRSDLSTGTTHFDSVSRDESLASGLPVRVIDLDTYVPLASPLRAGAQRELTVDLFDREFFNMTAAEARATDPQHRLLLTLAHEAMESSGLTGGSGVCGSYVTASASSYYVNQLLPRLDTSGARIDFPSTLGNDRDFASTRIAYKLGFTGPAITVQSACSSSLVTLHQACLGLAYGDVDIAVVGAVSLKVPQLQGYVFEHGGILSPTGESRPFDERANGTVRGSGGGAVVLRRLPDALANGDNILAVVAGTAINNDGANRMSFSAPAASGQQRVLAQALARAQITADQVGYIEAHGTGTPLGDPIEFKAISRAYKLAHVRHEPRYLGSAKANYGHLDVAAGIVGLLKAMLVVKHGQVFPQPGFTNANSAIDLPGAQFTVATAPVEPIESEYAAVSSFGMGGTNAHVVLRRGPATAERSPGGPESKVTVRLTARTDARLADYRRRMAEYLGTQDEISLADIAATLKRRTEHAASWSATVGTVAELVATLTGDRGDVEVAVEGSEGRQIWLPPSPLNETYCSVPPHSPALEGDRPVTENAAHATDVHSHFFALVADELGVTVDEHTDFFEAGGESIALVGIVGKFSQSLEFKPDFDELDGTTLVRDMATVLSAQASRSRYSHSSPVRLLHFGPDDGRRIYFYPPAGGTNFCYAALSRLSQTTRIHAFKSLSSAHATIEDIAAECISTLKTVDDLSRPLLLGGYSFGGNVTYEIARQLEAAGYPPPEHIIMFDSYAPKAFRHRAIDSHAMAVEIERLARSASSEDMNRFKEIWLGNIGALARYKPTGSITAPITLLRAEQPLTASRSRALGIDVEAVSDWREYTDSTLRVIDTPGDHYTIFTDKSHLGVLARTFNEIFERHR